MFYRSSTTFYERRRNPIEPLNNRCVCLSGVHRSGKTETAILFGNTTKTKYFPMNLGDAPVWEHWNKDSSQEFEFTERLEIQWLLLQWMRKQFSEFNEKTPAGKRFITDRSPLDLIVYLMANSHGMTTVWEKSYQAVIDDCNKALNECVNKTFVISRNDNVDLISMLPGRIPENKRGEKHNSIPYRKLCDALFHGVVETDVNNEDIIFIPKHLSSIETRVEFMKTNLKIND